MDKTLTGMRVAILVADDFEQVELTEPRDILEQAGATTTLVAPKAGQVHGMQHDVKADAFDVGLSFEQANAHDFDAVLLPGGVINADQLRTVPAAQEFVKDIAAANKPIAVICHGPWLLVSADLVDGRTLTSWPSLRDDIVNAGGKWVDQEVAVDDTWVSSRKPGDIPAFGAAMLEVFGRQMTHPRVAVAGV